MSALVTPPPGAREAAAEELTIAEYDRKNNPDTESMATAVLFPWAPRRCSLLIRR